MRARGTIANAQRGVAITIVALSLIGGPTSPAEAKTGSAPQAHRFELKWPRVSPELKHRAREGFRQFTENVSLVGDFASQVFLPLTMRVAAVIGAGWAYVTPTSAENYGSHLAATANLFMVATANNHHYKRRATIGAGLTALTSLGATLLATGPTTAHKGAGLALTAAGFTGNFLNSYYW